ncbi:hypothetical protein EMN47_09065 [Prolixibacteraceae bacterium JC049]|nr:hypothetical protein [Prolixibacteraceae bacterium JC049]
MSESKANQCASTATIYACQKVARTFNENIFELSHVRKEWTREYALELTSKIEHTIQKHFEQKKLKGNLPENWEEVPMTVVRDLSLLRAEIKVDFKGNKAFQKRVFNELGYSEFYSEARNGDYMSLFYLLCTFRQKLTEEFLTEITGNGIGRELPLRIVEAANKIIQNEDCIEWFKRRELVNNLAEKDVADIHDEIKNICRIASSYYLLEPAKKEKFCFYKVLRNMKN